METQKSPPQIAPNDGNAQRPTDGGLPPGARPTTAVGHPDMVVYEWRDAETDAEGWIAIEADDRLPPVGGGGLFVSPTTTESEVVDVARSMARKLRVTCVAGAVRGAKGGIRYDPAAPDVEQVLARFIKANATVIRQAWATGADLNTDHHVLDNLARAHIGIPHCLYALASRYPAAEPARLLGIAPAPTSTTTSKDDAASPRFGLAEATVGYGVARALREITTDGSLTGLDVAVQGFGTVGSTFALYAQMLGARIVAIADRDHFVITPGGIDVRAWLLRRQQQAPNGSALLIDCLGDSTSGVDLAEPRPVARKGDESNDAWLVRFFDACGGGVDVFAPCAQRYVMTPATMEAFAAALSRRRALLGPERRAYVASGANNIARDPEAFEAFLDAHNVWTVPEWVSNAGTACLFMEASTLPPPTTPDYESVLAAVGDRVATFVARAKDVSLANGARGESTPSSLLSACHVVADAAVNASTPHS